MPHLLEFASLLLAALLSSFHCAGMCGPLAMGASAGQSVLRSQALYHLGKSTIYVGAGAIAGLLGERAARDSLGSGVGRTLAVLAGLAMIGLGVSALRKFSARRKDSAVRVRLGRSFSPLADLFQRAASYHGRGRALVLGTLSGMLPCPLVYAFLAKAASTASVAEAIATMAVLGLGTIPALVLVAATGSAISPRLRGRFVTASGLLVMLLGAYTIYRAFAPPPCCQEPEHLRLDGARACETSAAAPADTSARFDSGAFAKS